MKHAADLDEPRVLAAGREQRDAERHAVVDRRRQRQPGEIEQVDEIGIGAEPAVQLNWIGENLLDRVGGGRGRQRERVDLAEGMLGNAPQLFQL